MTVRRLAADGSSRPTAVLPRHVLPAGAATAGRACRSCARHRRRVGSRAARSSAAGSRLRPTRRAARLADRRADPRSCSRAALGAARELRRAHGGFGGAPKFPPTDARVVACARRAQAVGGTLRAMARGGICDHLGGGFARYSVDAPWLVPHFEKMLYDQAQLAWAYLHAWQVSGADARVRCATRRSGRRFSSARARRLYRARRRQRTSRRQVLRVDARADTRVLGPAGLADDAIAYFGATELGNFEHGANVLEGRGPEPDRLPEIRCLLYGARARARPAGPRRQAPDLVERADDLGAGRGRRGARAPRLRRRRGRVRGVPAVVSCATTTVACCAPGRTATGRIGAYLEDHAFLLAALITLYETTFDPRWYRRGGAARRHDHRALRGSRARWLLHHRRRPRAAARAPQGPRGLADPVRQLGRRDRAAAASRCCRARAATSVTRSACCASLYPLAVRHPQAFGASARRRSTSTCPRSARSRSSDPSPRHRSSLRVVREQLPAAHRARRRRRRRRAAARGTRACRRPRRRLRLRALRLPGAGRHAGAACRRTRRLSGPRSY